MEYEEIKSLIKDFSNSNLTSLEIELNDGTKIDVKKPENHSNVEYVLKNKEEKVEEKEIVEEGKIIKSPMVGTFYSKSSPNAKPFVEIGKQVNKGDVVCIIEAMKLMNEIESDYTGKITEVYVKDGSPIEYGQKLFKIV